MTVEKSQDDHFVIALKVSRTHSPVLFHVSRQLSDGTWQGPETLTVAQLHLRFAKLVCNIIKTIK